jgi:hypothetical protein
MVDIKPISLPAKINLLKRDRVEDIESELSRLAARRSELERELAHLLSPIHEKSSQPLATVDSQIELLLQMFRCRESVYPKLWENHAKGTSGYAPTCDSEWIKGVCGSRQMDGSSARNAPTRRSRHSMKWRLRHI